MTREEAIDLLDNLIGMVNDNHDSDYDTALKMAIKALENEPRFLAHSDGKIEQIIEPCDDAVSRQALLNKVFEIKTGKNTSAMVVYAEDIRKELPILPKREQGEWIFEEVGVRTQVLKCSKCGTIIKRGENFTQEEFKKYINDILRKKCITLDNFCHNCGAEMR